MPTKTRKKKQNALNGKKILIVEDEEPLRRMLADGFVSEGFAVYVARDGDEGLQFALSERPDVILLDVLLPCMDGIEVLKRLRNGSRGADDDWGRQVEVILLTNITNASRIAEAVELGVRDYLVKAHLEMGDVIGKVKEKVGLAAA